MWHFFHNASISTALLGCHSPSNRLLCAISVVQAIAAVKARCKQMAAEANSALKSKTSALKAELDKVHALLQNAKKECSAAQVAAASLSDEALITSHAQLQLRLADAFTALRCLGVVPSTDATLQLAIGTGGVDRVIETLGTIVVEASSAVSLASPTVATTGTAPAIMHGLGAKELVAALVRQGKIASVAAAVCVALRGLVAADATSASSIIRAGGIAALASVLAQHTSSAAVVEAASGALYDIARMSDVGAPELAQVVEPLIAAVAMHGSAPGIVLQACATLRCALPTHGGGRSNVALSRPVVVIPFNTVPFFISLFVTHGSNDTVLENALFALSGVLMQDVDATAPEMLRCHGIEAVIALLASHSKDPSILQAACSVLGSAVLSALAKSAFLSAGGVAALNGVLISHADLPDVVAAACHALAKVARGSPDAQTAIGNANGVALVVAALASHIALPRVAEAACYMLWDTTDGHTGNKAAVVAAAGVPRVVATLVTHMGQAEVLEAATGALRSVVAGSIESIAMAVRAGAIPALADCLEEHAGTRAVVEQVCECVCL
jgi:hypothetical protein